MNPGDQVKVIKGSYTAWQGEVTDVYGSTWVSVNLRYRGRRASTTVPPDHLQVLEPACEVPGWDYYTPDDEDEDNV